MSQIKDQYFSGERPLYESRDIELHSVTIGEGESGLKECRNIQADHCTFNGMYVIWEFENVECTNCLFAATDRAPLWYGHGLRLSDCRINAPKPLRELTNITIERTRFKDTKDAFWFCRDGQLVDIHMKNAEYAFFQSSRLCIDHLWLIGKYAFQYACNIEIRNAVFDTKDAFWESENVTVYDSELKGEYLGWYAKNLRLVRCHISGTQPLCYCENLILEDCTFAPDADLAFEKSSVRATIIGNVTSIKNPLPGSVILLDGVEYTNH